MIICIYFFLLSLYRHIYFSGFTVENKVLDFANIVSGSSELSESFFTLQPIFGQCFSPYFPFLWVACLLHLSWNLVLLSYLCICFSSACILNFRILQPLSVLLWKPECTGDGGIFTSTIQIWKYWEGELVGRWLLVESQSWAERGGWSHKVMGQNS